MLFPPSRDMSFDAALRDLSSTDPRVRAAAADALGDTPAGADRARAVAGLELVLDDGRYEVRCAAALALGDLEDHAAVPPLLAHMQDGHPEVRQAIIIALGRLGDPRAVEPLIAAISEGPPDVRFQAVRSLAELDANAAFEPLCRALSDSDPEVRESAAESMALLGEPRAAGWLADLLNDKRPQTRFAAAAALAGLQDARGYDVLVAALGDREAGWVAVEALEALGDARAAAPLAGVVRRFLAPAYIRVRAAAALLTLAPGDVAAPAARSFLAKSTRSRRADVKGLAEECLARLAAK
jgi:HEAT repeat protein